MHTSLHSSYSCPLNERTCRPLWQAIAAGEDKGLGFKPSEVLLSDQRPRADPRMSTTKTTIKRQTRIGEVFWAE